MVAFAKPHLKPHTPDRSAKDSGHRFYSPEISRWLNRDPIGEWDMQTLYGFVHNNPTHQVDSVGLQPVNVVDVVSVPCCSCCCPEDISADIGNLELKTELFSVGPFVDGNYYKDIWQHPVKINIDLSYDNPGAQNSDCTFEYWEWVDEEGEGEFDQDWDDHADAYAAQWDARTKTCRGAYSHLSDKEEEE